MPAEADATEGPLGQKCDAPDEYAPDVLFPIARSRGRSLLGLEDGVALPFAGEDVWNCYELSWLNARGVPRRSALEVRIPCDTPFLVESKSLKLYLNSLSFKRFSGEAELLTTIRTDVARTLGCEASRLTALLRGPTDLSPLDDTAWECVDDEDVGELAAEHFSRTDETHLVVDANAAAAAATGGSPAEVTERLVSHLLRTLCPVTGQPDWGTVLIEYTGRRMDRAGLLRYLTSLRREVGFHENAVEALALAIQRQCAPRAMRITGRFLRRGGIDINPVRTIGNGAAEDAAAVLAPVGQAQWRVPGQ